MSPVPRDDPAILPRLRADLGTGLSQAFSLSPSHGYLAASGGVSALSGPFVRGEAGVRLADNFAAYGLAEWNRVEPMAGVGVRWNF